MRIHAEVESSGVNFRGLRLARALKQERRTHAIVKLMREIRKNRLKGERNNG